MPANKQRPPFRAEHLGSLLRPAELVEKRIQLDDKKALEIVKDDELHALEDSAINEIVKLQLDLGYHAINDGEYRRHQFWGTFFPNLEGFEEIVNPEWDIFRMYVPDTAAFSKSKMKLSHVVTRLTHYSPQPRRVTSRVRLLCVPARSSTSEARICLIGTISRS